MTKKNNGGKDQPTDKATTMRGKIEAEREVFAKMVNIDGAAVWVPLLGYWTKGTRAFLRFEITKGIGRWRTYLFGRDANK